MLAIRQAQMEVFGDSLRIRFEGQLVQHFMNLYPRETREAGGETQIAKLVRMAAQRAMDQGCERRKEIGMFVSLTFILGNNFDADPQIPWAGAQLRNPSIQNASLRVEGAYDTALEYLGATAGEECEHLVRAMLRVRAYDLAKVPDSTGELWVDDFCGVLRAIYPRKFDYQGDAANRELIALGLENAGQRAFRSKRSAAIWITLMFMLGSGFDEDLLYPWAPEALACGGQEDERADRLYRAAMSHLERSLSADTLEGAS